MYCLKCGQRLPDNARFCPRCGTDQYAAWNRTAPDLAGQTASPQPGPAVPPPQPQRQSDPGAQPSKPAPAGKPKKKKWLVILGLFALFFIGAWIWERWTWPKMALPENKAYAPLESRYSYNALPDDTTRELYKKLAEAAYNRPSEDDERYRLGTIPIEDADKTQFFLAYRAFTDDHPEVFWLYWGTRRLRYDKGEAFTPDHYVIYSQYSLEELKEMKTALYGALEQFLGSVPAGLDERQLQQYTHDYLIDHCDYDYAAVEEGEDYDALAHEAYGALVEGEAVCSGYAMAYQLMLNRLGVECVPIYGQGDPIDSELQMRTGRSTHQWNAVRDGGVWVMTDTTWDDTDDPTRQYDYFNIPIQQMYLDHNAQAINFDTFHYIGGAVRLNTEMDCLFLPQ